MESARIQLRAFLASAFMVTAAAAWGAAGLTGGDILKSRLGARPVAMGEAYTALGDDIASVLYNPAGLASLKGPSVSFSHFNAFAQVTYENFSYAHPLGFGTMGLNFVLRNQPDINNPLATDNPVSAYDLVLGLSYAQRPAYFIDDLPESVRNSTLGLSVKWVRSHLGRYDADSMAFDFGGRVDLGDKLFLGVSALNFGPPLRFIQASDPLPASINLGVSKSLELFSGNNLNAAVDFEYPMLGDSRLHFGVEDWLGKSLALRVGYLLEQANYTGGMTAGISLRLDQETLMFGLDYAFRPVYYSGFDSFEAQNLFSLSLGF